MKNLALLLAIVCLTGCSVVMATQQPDRKDLGFLTAGTPKERVDAELGAPVSYRENEDGTSLAVYKFKQGYSKGAKAGRAFFHGAADVLTCGLWEVVGTPVEAVATGTDTTVTIVFDAADKVQTAAVSK